MDFEGILAEALFVKNTQLEYGGFSPFTMVFGRMPRGLFSLDPQTLEAIEDGGEPPRGQNTGNLESTIRLREIAAKAFIEAIVLERLR